MAKSITSGGGRMNRRVLLLALAAGIVGAILVYAALSRGSDSSDEAAGTTGATGPVVMAIIDIPARTKISADMVELRDVPLDNRSDLAFTDPSAVVGRVSRYPIATSEQVLSTKVVALESAAETGASLSYIIPEDRRGISIGVSEVVSTGGLVLPGDYVDIIAVFDVKFGDDDEKDAYFARTILQNVEVLAVAQTVVDTPPEAGTAAADGETVADVQDDDGQRVRNTEADPNPGAATVTLSVTPQEAQLIFLAEENATLRLAVRPYGDAEYQDVPFIVETELIPPNLPGPVNR
jgi:pilus assembly protein CpaB